MKIKFIYLLLLFATLSCGGFGSSKQQVASSAAVNVVPEYYTYEVVATYPHAVDSYTQGLIFHDGRLLEGTGQVGESRLLEVDLSSGRTKELARLKGSHFGEGITILGDTLYQLTWRTNRLFMYDATTAEKIGEKVYSGEGWGITTDGEKLYTSDGSAVISVRNPATFAVERRVLATINGEAVDYLNELEWIEGKIWANVYTLNQIVIIDPESGAIEGVVDLTGILADDLRTPTTDVLNGIAYDAQGDRLFVTGKNWGYLFEIKVIKQ